MFIDRGWVHTTRRCKDPTKFYVTTQLYIMCALEHLGNRKPIQQFTTDTEMSSSEHHKFMELFIERMYEVREEFVRYPSTFEQLKKLF